MEEQGKTARNIETNSVRFFTQTPVTCLPDQSELIIAAWRLSNAENIGKIIRLAHNLGASQAFFIQGSETHRVSKIKKTAGFSFNQQTWTFIDEAQFLHLLEEHSLTVLETCTGSTNIFTTPLPKRTILLAGSESHGIPKHIIQKASTKVFIPMPGACKSMNVSNALAAATFEWLRQTCYATED